MDEGQVEVDITALCEQVDDMVEDMQQLIHILQVHGAWLVSITRALEKAGIHVEGTNVPTLQ